MLNNLQKLLPELPREIVRSCTSAGQRSQRFSAVSPVAAGYLVLNVGGRTKASGPNPSLGISESYLCVLASWREILFASWREVPPLRR